MQIESHAYAAEPAADRINGLVKRIQVVPLEAADAPEDQQGDG